MSSFGEKRLCPYQNEVQGVDNSSTSTKKVKVGHIKFQDEWLQKYSWLQTNTTKDRLFCKLCKNNNSNNVFAKDGSMNIQKSALVEHQNSIDHKSAVNREIQIYNKSQAKISDLFNTRKDAKGDILENQLFYSKK